MRAYPEPHQVSEVSSLWPNGRKRAREFGKTDPYLRYKDWLRGSRRAVSSDRSRLPDRMVLRGAGGLRMRGASLGIVRRGVDGAFARAPAFATFDTCG